MSTSERTAHLLTARTPAEAQIVASLLRSEGIETYIGGQALTDEFAASQRMLGLQGTAIAVHAEDLDRAQTVLADARRSAQAAELLTGDVTGSPQASATHADAPEPHGRTGALVAAWTLATLAVVAAAVLLFTWLETKRQLDWSRAAGAARKTRTSIESEGTRTVWKDTNKLASLAVDADHDGVPEVTSYYDHAGVKYATVTDADENGWPEKRQQFRDERLVAETIDADENGWPERMTTWWSNGNYCVWSDVDEDGAWDRRELFDRSGLLGLVQKDHGLQGFSDMK